MEKIKVACACGKRMAAPPEFAGKTVRCPACGSTLQIPGARVAAEPAPPDAAGDLLNSFPAAPVAPPTFPTEGGGAFAGAAAVAPRAQQSSSQDLPVMWLGVGGAALVTLLLTIVVVASLVGEKDWRTYHDPVGHYSVEFPAEFKIKSDAADWQIPRTASTDLDKNVVFTTMCGYRRNSATKIEAAEELSRAVQRYAKKYELIETQDLTFNGHPGREFKYKQRANGILGFITLRKYRIENRSYILMVSGRTAADLDNYDVKRFLNSLQLD